MINETVSEKKIDFAALLETGRSNFVTHFLKNLSGGLDYAWFCLPPHEHSGGILVGINSVTLSVVKDDFCVKFQVRSKMMDVLGTCGSLWSCARLK